MITKTNKKSYSFVSCTTGAGLEFHDLQITNGVVKGDSYLRLEKVQQKNLCRLEFFQSLLELQTLPIMDNSVNFHARNIYKGLLPTLKGKIKKNPHLRKHPWMMRKPQHSGSCAMEAIFGLIRGEMLGSAKTISQKRAALQEYRQLKFAYRKRSLLDACKYFFDASIPWSKTEQDLIADGLSRLARFGYKLKKHGLIAEEEYKALAFTNVDIRNRLSEKKQDHLKSIPAAPPLSFAVNPIQKQVVSLEQSVLEKSSNVAEDIPLDYIEIISITPLSKIAEVKPDLIADTLQQWVDELTTLSAIPNVNHDQISAAISEFLYALPLTKEFWNKVPSDQITPCLELFYKLTNLYYHNPRLNLPMPQVVIGSYIPLVIGEHLARRDTTNKLKEFQLNYVDLIKFSQSSVNTLLCPVDQDKLQQVLKAVFPQPLPFLSARKLDKMRNQTIFNLHQCISVSYNTSLHVDRNNLEYYKQFFKDAAPNFAKRGLDKLDSDTQLGHIISESIHDEEILPKGALYLRQLSFLASGILQGAVVKKPSEDWRYKIEKEGGFVRAHLKEADDRLDLMKSHNAGGFDYLYAPMDDNQLFKDHFYYSRQNHLMAAGTGEEQRDRRIINCEKADEVVRTLAYYRERPESLLEEPIEQYLFFQHLLRPGKLLEQLVLEPTMAVKLMSFINQRLAFFQSSEKRDPFLYFCQLGHFCSDFVKYAQEQHPERFKGLEEDLKTVLIDYRKTAIETYLPLCKNFSDRNVLFQKLKAFHLSKRVEQLTREEIKIAALDYFLANIYLPISYMHAPKLYRQDWHHQFQSKSYNLLIPKAKDLMKQDSQVCNDVLNGILSGLLQKEYTLNWKGSFPKFVSGSFEIDLSTNQVSEDGQTFTSLPPWIFVENNDFKLMFDQIEEVKVKEDGKYLIKDKQGITEIAVAEEQKLFHAERRINGTQYRYIPKRAFPEAFEKEIRNHIFEEDSTIWMVLEGPQPHYLIKKKSDPTKDLYIYLKQVSPDNYQVETVTDDPQKKRILINPHVTTILSAVDDTSHIFCWADSQQPNQLKEIELRRFGLHFDIEKGRANCREIPGFHLSAHQRRDFGDEWPSYLVLEDENQIKKVLIPKVKHFEKQEKQNKPFDISLKAVFEGNNSNEMALYEVEEVEGIKRLKASSTSDYLFLASLYFERKSYEEALYYLRRAQKLELYAEADLTVLERMETHFFNDDHPSAIVLGLKVNVLKEENRLKYDPKYHLSIEDEDKAKDNPLIKKYLKYVQNLNNTSLVHLSIEEEKSLMRLFISSGLQFDPTLYQRMQLLLNPQTKNSLRPVPEELTAGAKNFREMFEFFSLFAEAKKPENEELLIGISSSDFFAQYAKFYQWAHSGTAKEKRRLAVLLEFLKGSNFYQQACEANSREILVPVRILREVLKRPKKFPSAQTILAATKTHYETPFYRKYIEKNLLRSFDFSKIKRKMRECITYFVSFIRFKKVKRDLMFDMPRSTIQNKEAKMPYTCSFSPFDHAQDLFFNDILSKFFTVEEKKLDERTKIEKVKDDPYLDQVIKDLESFYETRDPIKKIYHLNGSTNLLDSREELSKGLTSSSAHLAAKEKELLQFVNKPSIEYLEDDLVKKSAKKYPTLNLSQAIELFEEGKLSKYRTLTCLQDVEIEQFEGLMTQYLVMSTRHQQACRVLSYLNAYEKQSSNPEEKEILIQKMGEELCAKRSYSEKQKSFIRTFLVFEHRNQMLLRAKQVDILEKVLHFPVPMRLLLKLGTGSGKSKVLAKLFEWGRRQLVGQVINVWPSELYPVNKYDSKKQSETTFNQLSDTLDFNRDVSTNIHHLHFVLRELKKSVLANTQLNAHPESIQAIELKFLEILFYAVKQGVTPFEGKIQVFQACLKEISEIEAHFDEGHIALAAKRELNFTVGDAYIEPVENVLFLEEIFRYLSQDKEMLKLINIKANQQELIAEETIVSQICPAIAKHMLQSLKIDPTQQPEWLEYVLNKKDLSIQHPQKQLIDLLKGEIALLPKILYEKSVNVHYGLSKLHPEILYAKPFDASDSPVERADYDNVHETFSKTYFTYLHVRLTEKKIWDVIKNLQDSALRESSRSLIPVQATEAYQFYQEHFPKGMGDLFRVEQAQIANWSEQINKDNEIILYYVRTFVAPTIKAFPFKFKSNVQNLMSQFKHFLAMSATPGSPTGYGHATHYQTDLGSDEQVLDALDKKCVDPKTMHEVDSQTPSDFFNKILSPVFNEKNDFRVLIDIGAMFKGLKNLDMAQKLLQHFSIVNPDIKGIVFFHEEKLMVLEMGRKELIPFEQCLLPPENRFTLYDHKHRFGLDVKQSAKAVALATYSKQTTNDDILQGVGRMRELLQNQKVEWVSSKAVLRAIHNQNRKFVFNDLRKLGFKNQAELEAENLPKSIKQQMHNEIRSVLMHKLIHAKSESKAIRLAKEFFLILLEKVEMDPSSLYGGTEQEKTDFEDLFAYRDALLKQLEGVSKLKKSEKATVRKRLLEYTNLIKQKEKCFSPEKKRHMVKTGVEAEIQQNIETNTEVSKETQKASLTRLQRLKSTPWSNDINLFKDQWIQTTPIYFIKVKQVVKRTLNLPMAIFRTAYRAHAWIGISEMNPLHVPISVAVVALSIPLITASGVLALASSLVNRSINLLGKVTRVNTACQIYASSTVVKLANDRKISNLHSLFKTKPHAKLLMTNNFIPLSPRKVKHLLVNPLGNEQRYLYEVLVVEEEKASGEKDLTVIMGDQSTDASFWRHKLAEDTKNTSAEEAGKRKRKICLYDLNVGIVQNGKNAFNEQELKSNPVFQELIVKAKIYNADVSYSKTEEEILRKIAKDPKTKDKLKKFYERALVWREEKQAKYLNSPIDLVLNQGVEAA